MQGEQLNLMQGISSDKCILDVTCGSRSIWFDKKNKRTVYCDIRKTVEPLPPRKTRPNTQYLVIDPDIVCDFRKLPFDNESFKLVVFDPPHAIGLQSTWTSKKYGTYDSRDEMLQSVSEGFKECWRVLEDKGVLIFKWADVRVKVSEIIGAFGVSPLFGHTSGKKSGTHWMCFMKGV